MLTGTIRRTFLIAAALLVAVGAPRAAGGADRELTVAAVQTELRFWPSAEAFSEHMSQRVEAAMEHDPDLVVLPEDIGLPLIGFGDLDLLAGADDMPSAIGAMLRRHSEAVGAMVRKHGVSPQRALWLVKAPMIRRVYENTFSALAREHGVYIVAGSAPMVQADRPAQVLNTACVFDPDGKMQIAGRKMNLVPPFETEEGLDFARATMDDYQIIEMPGATIGVIVCADGWDPRVAERLVEQGAEVLVQVSANPEVWTDRTRLGWLDSLFTRVQEVDVYGVYVMAVGDLLGLPFQGQSAVVAPRDRTLHRSGFIAEAESATEEEMVVVTLDLAASHGR